MFIECCLEWGRHIYWSTAGLKSMNIKLVVRKGINISIYVYHYISKQLSTTKFKKNSVIHVIAWFNEE